MNGPPNNSLHGRNIRPALIWNDAEILTRAGQALGATPEPRTSHEAEQVRELFAKNEMDPPTRWATLQWVRRREIPDRWRATLVYLLLRDRTLGTGHLFRKAPQA